MGKSLLMDDEKMLSEEQDEAFFEAILMQMQSRVKPTSPNLLSCGPTECNGEKDGRNVEEWYLGKKNTSPQPSTSGLKPIKINVGRSMEIDASSTSSSLSNVTPRSAIEPTVERKVRHETAVMSRIKELSQTRLPMCVDPPGNKTQSDSFLEEVVLMATDFKGERNYKRNAASKVSSAIAQQVRDKETEAERQKQRASRKAEKNCGSNGWQEWTPDQDEHLLRAIAMYSEFYHDGIQFGMRVFNWRYVSDRVSFHTSIVRSPMDCQDRHRTLGSPIRTPGEYVNPWAPLPDPLPQLQPQPSGQSSTSIVFPTNPTMAIYKPPNRSWTLGNGTEGNLQEHAAAPTSQYYMDGPTLGAATGAPAVGATSFDGLATGIEGATIATGIEGTTLATGIEGGVGFSGGPASFGAAAGLTIGNGTEGNLANHAGAPQSTYQLDAPQYAALAAHY
ncbi:hypothetical protein L596_022936 [Steinernema carpocapsae]|uniref:Myb-like domain-containing protein n=1 Tax=Steinernema carpocapsae TaxID=34508 RepID=A0A4U5MC33_STECR|nr:hypothetical protein L596_022936 [Steinernema carpocapsae]